ncbi:ABC transporter substrate-binding protein [Chelatococcus reniformis]|uniref:Amino acid ABC transporter substrate-binding protein n=1 Tax=Chelatococcus reniformis TaxID=1494448 RepID=A0A916TWM2_9HYPH|nr:ABC transporter substrate-binding protein [Chelatococcus reniformis]GGC44983.1 amino acid ABC transporter substrate-binding protein [Chelatococcus reniformis]
MTVETIVPGVLTVASAVPDPPFEMERDGALAGFDIALMQALAAELGLTWRACRYEGADFNGIFDGLESGAWDCVASGTTITPEREAKVDFCAPYVISGQSLVCNVARHPTYRSVRDLGGQVIAVQKGNTSQPVAERLKAQGAVAEVRVYPYAGIGAMLDDLEAGRIAAIMKLAPVMRWLTRDRSHLEVVQDDITVEKLGICVRKGNAPLREALDAAQARLAADGRLGALVTTWIKPRHAAFACSPGPTAAPTWRTSPCPSPSSRRLTPCISRRAQRMPRSTGTPPRAGNTSSP